MPMQFREATTADIPQIQRVRNAVKENVLSDPELVTDEDCRIFMSERGKGWVCVADEKVVGFAIADLVEENIWALFVDPEHEGKGIGKNLQRRMLDWYFGQEKTSVWLGTAPGTRAAGFYNRTGWTQNGWHGNELKFEMKRTDWIGKSTTSNNDKTN